MNVFGSRILARDHEGLLCSAEKLLELASFSGGTLQRFSTCERNELIKHVEGVLIPLLACMEVMLENAQKWPLIDQMASSELKDNIRWLYRDRDKFGDRSKAAIERIYGLFPNII